MSLSSKSTLLSGVRVVDLTRVLAGPFMTMVLGDMGADVIKIEKPGEGDDTRLWGPPFCGTESAYFLSVNRNKRSVAIDFKHKDGLKLLKRLAAVSDVFVENFVPGKMDALGIGYENLKEMNPGLIYCSITGFGPTGPYAQRPGYDVIAASYGGLNHITGPEDGEPCKVGVALTDICTGLYAHGAILAALRHRDISGFGQKIDCDLLSTQIATLANISSNYLNNGLEAKRWGTAHQSLVPYQAFKTRDSRYITVGATSNKQFEDLCDKLNMKNLAKDKRFLSNKDRVNNRSILIGILEERFLSKPCEEWLDVFQGCAFPYGPINNMERVFSDPHVLSVGLVQEFSHPTIGKKCRVTAPPVRYGGYSYPPPRPPPTLGQHTSEVLHDILGYTDRQIQTLYDSSVVA